MKLIDLLIKEKEFYSNKIKMTNQYKQEIEDFRELKPYYHIIFDNMRVLSEETYNRNYLGMANALRELIINASPYIKNPDKKLEEIDSQLEALLKEEFFSNGEFRSDLPKQNQEQLRETKDKFLSFIRDTRIQIQIDLSKYGILPRSIKRKRPKSETVETEEEKIEWEAREFLNN